MKSLPITSKQLEILKLLYKFRFLNTNQFKSLLNHKNPTRIQVWLKDLVQKEYVYSNYERNKFGQNTKPSVFHLLPKARYILKKLEGCDYSVLNKIYKEGQRSKSFISNALFLADIYLSLKKQTISEIKLYFFTKVDLLAYNYLPNPLPDAYIALKESKQTKRYFMLLLEEKAPRYALAGKIKKYINYSESSRWEENNQNRPYPATLIICPDYPKKRFITKFINEHSPREPFYLTTKNTIRLKGIKKDIWEKVE